MPPLGVRGPGAGNVLSINQHCLLNNVYINVNRSHMLKEKVKVFSPGFRNGLKNFKVIKRE
jgi:hypothetical protein